MKQMYKVFITDKEVRFINASAEAPNYAHELSSNLTSAEIVDGVHTFSVPGARIFYIRHDNPQHRFEQFSAYFPLIRAAGGVVRSLSPAGPILMIHRLGKWDLPKGKIDPGEGQETAALREVREECGIGDLKIIKKLSNTFHLYEFRGVMVVKITYWYLMLSEDHGQLQPQLEEGITEVKWVNEKDIYHLLPDAYSSIADLLSKEVLNS